MKTLYLECKLGAAGDMLMGALYELLPDKDAFLAVMNSLSEKITVSALDAESCFIRGTRMEVKIAGEEEEPAEVMAEGFHSHDHAEIHDHGHGHEEHHHEHEHEHGHCHEHPHEHEHEHSHDHHHGHHHHHHHASMEELQSIISSLPVPEEVRDQVRAVYDLIAAAESEVHGKPVSEVHLHEVGALDAVADITGVCYALWLLKPDRIIASPVHLGSGTVRCAHGVMPVPAPATACLLRGIPCYTGEIAGELCTPTGAALLRRFVQSFGPMPAMVPERTGYGLGKKEFPLPNAVRAFLGEDFQDGAVSEDRRAADEEVTELCCHIDDMTPEELSFAASRLMSLGALDVAVTPMNMKKGRSGWSVTIVSKRGDEARLAEAALRETTTNGIRAHSCRRYILTPSVRTAETRFGTVRIKCAEGYGIRREKPEYDDAEAIALQTGLPIREVIRLIMEDVAQGASDGPAASI